MRDHPIRSNSSPGQQPAYDEKQETDRAQNKDPETQVERPEQSACVGLSEHLICKQLQSKTDEEQPDNEPVGHTIGCILLSDGTPALRSRVRSSFKPAPTRKSLMGLPQWRWAAVAASLALVSVLMWRAVPLLQTQTTDDRLIQEVTASHVRSLMVSHLVDIPSSDRHVVKPWFTGKLDFAPSVADLTEQGFSLIGGRLDYVNGRAVAGLVYKRREHVINVFLWPSAGAVETRSLAHQGYHLVCRTQSGMTYWAISDLNSRELQEFVHHIQSPPSHYQPVIPVLSANSMASCAPRSGAGLAASRPVTNRESGWVDMYQLAIS